MAGTLVRTITSDGLTLDGVLHQPASPGQEVFCLVHGTGGNFYNSSLFDFLTEQLLGQGHAVLRINTRGHDGISTSSTPSGGLRLGAAYEVVDHCRRDLMAWTDWLRKTVCPAVSWIGHSLGAVKCLYAAAHEPALQPARIVAISPPRLSYTWFCASAQGPEFLASFHEAERLVAAGNPQALLEVKLPLPMAIAAGGYVEKYGPDERYNFLNFLTAVRCPTLLAFGGIEVEKNMAFQGLPEEVTKKAQRTPSLHCETVPGADHFYSGVRPALWQRIEKWLGTHR